MDTSGKRLWVIAVLFVLVLGDIGFTYNAQRFDDQRIGKLQAKVTLLERDRTEAEKRIYRLESRETELRNEAVRVSKKLDIHVRDHWKN